MEKLPEEMLEEICQWLSVRDLVACCAVSRSWRDVINRDTLWRARCDPNLASYLSLATTECVVEPRFVSPDMESSGLSAVCEWRLNYMRQIHLWNNWRKGKAIIQQVETEGCPSARFTIYKNDFLVVSYLNSIELWDIRTKPVLYVKDPCILAKKNYDILPLSHLMYEDKIIIIQGQIVQVYQISLMAKEWSLDYFFLFNSDNISNCDSLVNNIGLGDGRFTNRHLLAGNYLVGLHPDDSMQIWNLKTKKKVKKETFLPRRIVHLLHWDPSSNNLAVSVIDTINFDDPDVEVYRVQIFSLNDFVFKTFEMSYTVDPFADMHYDKCFLLGPLIAIQFQDVVDIYNYETGEQLNHLGGNTSEEFMYLNLSRNKIFLKHDWYINQFNPITKSYENFVDNIEGTISSFKEVSDTLTVCFTGEEDLFEYIIFCRDGINQSALCFANEDSFQESSEYEPWKLVDGITQCNGRVDKAIPIPFKVPRSVKFAILNEACTKMVIERRGELQVLCFW